MSVRQHTYAEMRSKGETPWTQSAISAFANNPVIFLAVVVGGLVGLGFFGWL
jgi:hypothetical protein